LYRNLYLKFFFLFLFFGIFIVFSVYIINSSVLKNTVNSIKSNFTDSYFNVQTYNLRNSLDEAKSNLLTIINEQEFQRYINNNNNNNKDDEYKLNHIFYDYASSKNEILQLRYIDINGNEKIRIQKYDSKKNAEIISKDRLQNKKNRTYFKETINLEKGDFFVSNFNLNKEFGKVQNPIQPTLRISTCIYDKNNTKKGILILNINMNNFVNIFKKFENFNSYLIDKNGNFILHPDSNKQFTNDFKTNFNIKNEFDEIIAVKILTQNSYKSDFIFSYSLENIIENKQGLKIIYISHDPYIKNILKESNYKLLQIIIPLTLILGLILAIYPTRIREKLLLALAKNKRNSKIIDKYIPVSITDNKGIIIEVNEAFCNLTGYTSEELLGQSHGMLKSGNLDKELYEDLWETLKENKSWNGELENIKKNGQLYWIDMYIEPRYNKDTLQTEYMSISQNITDKKLIEKLSQTDHLTNLHNRKRIDEELEKSLYNVKRYNENISIMMLDIDYFKLVNDKYGHNVGDSVLVEFSNTLKNSIRKSDIIGRWGGEEFMIISSNTSKEEIRILANKIKDNISNFNFKIVGHKTVSIGYTQIKGSDSDFHSFLKRADNALYRAKENGRDRIESDEVINQKEVNNFMI